MDFRQFVTDHLARLGDEDPTAVFGAEGQMLLDISRQQDLDERADAVSPELQETNEITEVDELTEDLSSLTPRSKPAMDSAIFTQEELSSGTELDSSDPAQAEPARTEPASPDAIPEQFVQDTTELPPDAPEMGKLDQSPEAQTQQAVSSTGMPVESTEPETEESVEEAIPSKFLQERGEDATASETVALGNQTEAVAENPVSDQAELPSNPSMPIEFDESPDAIPEQFLESVSASEAELNPQESLPESSHASISRTSEIIDVPAHLEPSFNEMLAHIDEQIAGEGLSISVTEPGVELPDLPAINPVITDRGSVVDSQSRALMERERL